MADNPCVPLMVSTARCTGAHAAAAAAALLCACATQGINGSAVEDPATLATISATSKLDFLPSLVVHIDEVDGVGVALKAARVKVSPGLHHLTVTCRSLESSTSHTQVLDVDAEAGARYRLWPVLVRVPYPSCEAQAVKESQRSRAHTAYCTRASRRLGCAPPPTVAG